MAISIKYSKYLNNNIVGRRHIDVRLKSTDDEESYQEIYVHASDRRKKLSQAGQKGTPPVLKSPEGTFSLYSTFEELIMAQRAMANGNPRPPRNYDQGGECPGSIPFSLHLKTRQYLKIWR